MDVITGLTALGHAINITKFIREAGKELSGAELKAKMAEIYEKLSDAKMALVDAREEIKEYKTEIEKLKENARFKAEETIVRNGLRYEKECDGKIAVYPFCPKCEAKEGLMLRLMQTSNIYAAKCPNCQTEYAGDAVWYTKPQQVEREEQ